MGTIPESYRPILMTDVFKRYGTRYMVVDTETGEIIDDAHGYGFKTAKGAMKSVCYKLRKENRENTERYDLE